MDDKVINEIKELNKEISEIIKLHSEVNKKIILEKDFVFDQAKHNFPQELITKALVEGLHLEDKHLYPENPDKKHKGKNYYCIYRYKKFLLSLGYLLISYLKKPEKIILFHIAPLNFGSEEQRTYKEIQQFLKDFSPKKT